MSRFYYAGLSLIELMISLALSSIILLASMHLLQHTSRIYQQQQQYIQILEKIRYLEFIFTDTIHMAGFLGCHTFQHTHIHSSLKNWNLLGPYTGKIDHFPAAIMAYQVKQNAFIPSFIRQHAKKNSDILIVSNLSPHTTPLQQTIDNPDEPLAINNKLSFKKNDIAVINDCHQADIFAISSLNGSKNILLRHNISAKNKTKQLSAVYAAGAQIGEFNWKMFYLRQVSKKPIQYGLFLRAQNGRAEEISRDIDNFQLYFATATNQQLYLPIDLIKDFTKIKKVKIILTLRTSIKKKQKVIFYVSLRN